VTCIYQRHSPKEKKREKERERRHGGRVGGSGREGKRVGGIE
jgi:hypothetical protein